MTKTELIKENERLEQELHNSQNSCIYLERETENYSKLYFDLKQDVDEQEILKFLQECSVVQKQQLEDFIKTL